MLNFYRRNVLSLAIGERSVADQEFHHIIYDNYYRWNGKREISYDCFTSCLSLIADVKLGKCHVALPLFSIEC